MSRLSSGNVSDGRLVSIKDVAAGRGLRHGDRIAPGQPGVSDAEVSRANELLQECGCTDGERGAAIGSLIAATIYAALPRHRRARAARCSAAAMVIGASSLGKWLGIRRAVRAANDLAVRNLAISPDRRTTTSLQRDQ